ncbi:MAG: dockerin type I repeat-containing protein [Oscillospiraceae bacterium]|nr:dockerin type I repeat-containing protein [Oscillospiraceae bacterium]
MRKFTKQISALLAMTAVGSVTVISAAAQSNDSIPSGKYQSFSAEYQINPGADNVEYTAPIGTVTSAAPVKITNETTRYISRPIGTAAPTTTPTSTTSYPAYPIGTMTAITKGTSAKNTTINETTEAHKITHMTVPPFDDGEPDPKDIIPGDVYKDQIVDMTDLTLLSQVLIGDRKFETNYQIKSADMTKDGIINLADLAQLKLIIMMQLEETNE